MILSSLFFWPVVGAFLSGTHVACGVDFLLTWICRNDIYRLPCYGNNDRDDVWLYQVSWLVGFPKEI